MMMLAVPGVSLHFTRMVASGVTGSLQGQEERNRSQIEHLDENATLLAMVKPDVVVLAHTATSYTLGKEEEAALLARLGKNHGMPFVTAFGCVVEAVRHLGVKRIALGTPYDDDMTCRSKTHLEAHGIAIANFGRLTGVTNIYEETAERAYGLARSVDRPEAEAVFLSGVGMPTLTVLDQLEKDLGKSVISSAAAMMWNALRIARVNHPILGYGQLLAGKHQRGNTL